LRTTIYLLSVVLVIAAAIVTAHLVNVPQEQADPTASIERDVRKFVHAWIAGDLRGMYRLHSSDTRKAVPEKVFLSRLGTKSERSYARSCRLVDVMVRSVDAGGTSALVTYTIEIRMTARTAVWLRDHGRPSATPGTRKAVLRHRFVYEAGVWRIRVLPAAKETIHKGDATPGARSPREGRSQSTPTATR
jgi:hypothetical protein